MSDFPAWLSRDAADRFGPAFDVDDRLPAAIDRLAPLADHDVLLVDAPADGSRAGQIRAAGGRIAVIGDRRPLTAASADVAIAFWSGFDRPGSPAETIAREALRPGGRLIAIVDYGRDDLAKLQARHAPTPAPPDPADRAEAPFLTAGWRIRVIHCWWTFADLEAAQDFVAATPGGAAAAERLTKPRIAHNVAVLYRTIEPDR